MGKRRRTRDRETAPHGYTGSKDSKGQPHGRGTHVLDESAVFEGRFVHGVREGRGKVVVQEEDGDWIIMQGIWSGDELVYAADIVDSEGSVTRGPVKGGVVEEYVDGNRLAFVGRYEDGVRHGHGVIHHLGGGETKGVWKGGVLDETSASYQYPCRFEQRLDASDLVEDISDTSVISRWPLRPDPYESRRVYVKPVPEKGGEGLFARIPLLPHEVASFYNGVRLSHEVVDGRGWELNDNTLSLGPDEVIDVPPPWNETNHYCATLGHKANHCHVAPNAKYDFFEHPRHGFIKCIRVLDAPIAAGEEILVDYGFDGEHGFPEWWKPPTATVAK